MLHPPNNQHGFWALLTEFADDIATNFSQHVPAQPEAQLTHPVGNLLKAFGHASGKVVNYRSEVQPEDIDGRPDIGITLDGHLIGLIELKAPGVGAQPENFTGRNAEQWERFKEFPNLIYTDGEEWSLYQDGNGSVKARVRISHDIRFGRASAVIPDETRSLELLLRSFLEWNPIVPGTAEGLAKYLAPLTRLLRDEVRRSLARQASPLRALAEEWGWLLFPEGKDDQFADAYAQTLTYALLLARFEGANNLRAAFATDTLQRGHGLLAEALQLLEAPAVRNELRMPIELLERIIGAVDTLRLNRQGDPWIYFYEQFLGAYDSDLRKDRGVFYTPVEVVGIQTRLAAELLRTRFGKPLAFADEGVNVLDPAAGTGTYLISVIDYAEESVRQRYGTGAVRERLSGLADRLFGFEILVGAYAVAHMRLTQRFSQAGAGEKAPKVYLTDTLESPYRPPEFQRTIMQEQMTLERARAQELKRSIRVLVCIGNPPYDREARALDEDDGSPYKGGWVRYGSEGSPDSPIFEDFLAPAREAGESKNLKSIYNDYVYFWRWALWKVFDSTGGGGIVTFITASSYLRGPGFAGVRHKMRQVFDDLWIIDLGGEGLAARKTENIFNINTPVAIAVGVRYGNPNPTQPARVRKVRIAGTAEEKLQRLQEISAFADLPWEDCTTEWDKPFYPEAVGVYAEWPSLLDIFPWQLTGCLMFRTWPIGVTPDLLERRWRSLLSTPPSARAIPFGESSGRKITRQYRSLDGSSRQPSIAALPVDSPIPAVVNYAYRSFDRQWIIADQRVGDRIAPDLWRSHGPQQVYMTSLLTNVLGPGPAAIAASAVPDKHHFRGSYGGKDIVPLWRDAGATQANITRGLLEFLSENYGTEVSPEQLFAYAYGILVQPAYVERFWRELDPPPPRLPLTRDADLFERASNLGRWLLSVHTYGERFGERALDGEARCTKHVSHSHYPQGHSYDAKTHVLHVGDGRFEPVSPEVWEYSVSGMPVVKSWLDRRKRNRSGKKRSPLDAIEPDHWGFAEQLLELLWTLEETVRLQPESADLLEEICTGQLFTASELPIPEDWERLPPTTQPQTQGLFDV